MKVIVQYQAFLGRNIRCTGTSGLLPPDFSVPEAF